MKLSMCGAVVLRYGTAVRSNPERDSKEEKVLQLWRNSSQIAGGSHRVGLFGYVREELAEVVLRGDLLEGLTVGG